MDLIKGFNWLTFDGGKFSTSQKRGVFMDGALEILPRIAGAGGSFPTRRRPVMPTSPGARCMTA